MVQLVQRRLLCPPSGRSIEVKQNGKDMAQPQAVNRSTVEQQENQPSVLRMDNTKRLEPDPVDGGRDQSLPGSSGTHISFSDRRGWRVAPPQVARGPACRKKHRLEKGQSRMMAARPGCVAMTPFLTLEHCQAAIPAICRCPPLYRTIKDIDRMQRLNSRIPAGEERSVVSRYRVQAVYAAPAECPALIDSGLPAQHMVTWRRFAQGKWTWHLPWFDSVGGVDGVGVSHRWSA